MSFVHSDLIVLSLQGFCEEADVLEEPCIYTEQILVREQALLQTFIQEVLVSLHNLIDGAQASAEEFFFKFEEIRLQDLNNHVIDVILAEV